MATEHRKQELSANTVALISCTSRIIPWLFAKMKNKVIVSEIVDTLTNMVGFENEHQLMSFYL